MVELPLRHPQLFRAIGVKVGWSEVNEKSKYILNSINFEQQDEVSLIVQKQNPLNFCVLPFLAFATYLKLFGPKIILFQN